MLKLLQRTKKIAFLSLLCLLVCVKVHAQNWDEIMKQAATDRNVQSSAGREDDVYGWSVSVSGDYAVIGAYQHDGDERGINKIQVAGAAYVLYKNAGTWTEVKKLISSDRLIEGRFGHSVAISGDYVIVGAIKESRDAAGANTVESAGAAYIFKKDQGGSNNWGLVKKITAPVRDVSDLFGYEVKIDGDIIAVGVRFENHNAAEAASLDNSGSVYLYSKNQGGNENWGLVKKITAPTRYAGAQFGLSVAISGGYMAVGAYDSQLNSGSGAVYFFAKDQGGSNNWGYVQRVIPNVQTNSDNFGVSVAISGEYTVIGAYAQDTDASGANYLSGAGSAYLFKRNASTGNWSQTKKITAPVRSENDSFGHSVAISGDYIVVGADGEDQDALETNTKAESGSAYIFKKDQGGGENWGLLKKIVATSRNINDLFGSSVAISGNNILSGAYRHERDLLESNPVYVAGATYFYNKDQGGSDKWGQTQKTVSSGIPEDDNYGWSISVSGDYAAVGAPNEDESPDDKGTIYNTGAVYILHYDGTSWMQIKKLMATDALPEDNFGWSVSLKGDYLVVGAPNEDGVNKASDVKSGAAYVFGRNKGGENNWGQIKKIFANDRAAGDLFGFSVCIDGDFVIVGAKDESHDAQGMNVLAQAGSAYLFMKDQGGEENWGQIKKLVASDRIVGARFGNAVSISGDYALVGANEKARQGIPDMGSAYLFKKGNGAGESWGEIKIFSDYVSGAAGFGSSLAIDGENLIIGAVKKAYLIGLGFVFLYQKNYGGEDNWGQIKRIQSDYSYADGYGSSVAIHGENAVVSAPNQTLSTYEGTKQQVGAAYLYGINKGGENNWGLIRKMTPVFSQANLYDNYGYTVSISGDHAFIATPYQDKDALELNPLTNSGAVYIFKKQVSCATPTEIVASNIDRTSATISWPAVTSGYPVIQYEYGFSYGGSEPNWQIKTIQHTEPGNITANITDLYPGTSYSLWVRSVCRTDYMGDWGKVNFTAKLCPDNISEMEIPEEGSYYSGSQAIQDGNLTHYCDCYDNKLLLTIDHSESGVVIDQVSVLAGESEFYTNGEGFVTNPNGAAFLSRRWFVSANVQPNKPIKVRMYYKTEDFTALNALLSNVMKYKLTDESKMFFYKDNSTYPFRPLYEMTSAQVQIINHGSEPSTSRWVSGMQGKHKYAEFLVSSFSGGGAGGNASGTPLPVTLISFEARKKEQQAYLVWSSVKEVNTEYFQVERSNDGKSWKSLGTVQAAGESSQTSHYSFEDANPSLGQNLYRLKMMDKDATFAYSGIRSLDFQQTNTEIYPNPTADRLFISTSKLAEIESVSLINNLGNVVLKTNSLSKDGLDLSKLTSGSYSVQIKKADGSVEVQKVVIVR